MTAPIPLRPLTGLAHRAWYGLLSYVEDPRCGAASRALLLALLRLTERLAGTP